MNNLLQDKFSLFILLVFCGAVLYFLTNKKKVIEGVEFAEEDSEIQEMPEIIKDDGINQEYDEQVEDEIDQPVHKFTGNSKDDQERGAPIDQAFIRPMSAVCTPDKVDFSRNTMKKYDAKDYLPKEINDEWFDTDFQHAKQKIMDDSLINANRYVIGVNTVGSSHKNSTHDLRGEVPNPKYGVGPWNNSTYEPDLNIKPWA
jgi:hypothetical protein